MTDKWVDVKDWDEFEIGMKLRDAQREYTVTQVFTDEICTSDGVYPHGYTSQRGSFHPGKYQRLETTATEEEAPTGGWVKVKDWSELHVGMEVKRTGTQQGGYLDGILEITYVDHERFEHSKGGRDNKLNWENGFYTFEKRAETPKPTNQYQTLEKVFAPEKAEPAAKVIDPYPHTCHHCGSKSYNGEWSIDCSGNCAKSKS